MDGYMNELQQQEQQDQRYYSDMSFSIASGDGSSNKSYQKVNSSSGEEEEDEMDMMMDLRRGPWTIEEDHTLMSYIAKHGEGRWNSLARSAGLKRTGKSCRLRWLNYLRPDVRRGNITLEEQLLILELHSRWGNRWSKIAQHLPGRTDNEIKNYWRTRVQKHAKQLKCDVNSKQFKDTMRYLWIPRLIERIQASQNHTPIHQNMMIPPPTNSTTTSLPSYVCSENSSTTAASSDSFNAQVSPASDLIDNYQIPTNYNPNNTDFFTGCNAQIGYSDSLISPASYYHPQQQGADYYQSMNSTTNHLSPWPVEGGDLSDNLWNVEDIWLLQQQQFTSNY